jgi:hypothetical protein
MKTIIVTPAGRECFLRLLVPQIEKYVKAGVVDEYRLWVNTTVQSDIDYMHSLAETYSWITLDTLPADVACDGIMTIRHFFKKCTEDAVYVRLDDDIVLLDSVESFQNFVKFRIEHPEYFILYGNILNNAMVTYVLQHLGKLDTTNGVSTYVYNDPMTYSNEVYPAYIHKQVVDEVQAGRGMSRFHFEGVWKLLNHERVSINCISWLGSDFKRLCNGDVIEYEEDALPTLMPKRFGMVNAIYGGFCVVHYAFNFQRQILDRIGCYEWFKQLLS